VVEAGAFAGAGSLREVHLVKDVPQLWEAHRHRKAVSGSIMTVEDPTRVGAVDVFQDRAHWIAMGAVLSVVAYFCWLPGVAGVR
jgi:hypothetical protein